ncbi:hypothetical protein ACXO77_01055 [Lactobacillus delbrueckii subsp. bulgaricus]
MNALVKGAKMEKKQQGQAHDDRNDAQPYPEGILSDIVGQKGPVIAQAAGGKLASQLVKALQG